jgi:negative regulator of genetic competence, sporulation and motility
MSDGDETEADGRMGRADRIRSTREGRRSQSRRSRSEGDSDESESEQTATQSSQTSQTAQRTQTSQSSQRNEENTATQPVKDRPHRTVYLPSALDDEFDSQIDRIQYEAKHETEGEKVQLAKNRHVYPLIVHLGLERAGDMTIDDLLATLAEADTLDAPDQ